MVITFALLPILVVVVLYDGGTEEVFDAFKEEVVVVDGDVVGTGVLIIDGAFCVLVVAPFVVDVVTRLGEV
jgi:hypothetical protein